MAAGPRIFAGCALRVRWSSRERGTGPAKPDAARRQLNPRQSRRGLCQALAPRLKDKGWGRIVNFSSVSGRFGVPSQAGYCGAKHAVVGMTRALALELAPRKITVNAVCPGWVDTAMARPDVAARLPELEAEVPLGRIATPEDCARAILFYLSPLASYANGTALGLNGGSFLH